MRSKFTELIQQGVATFTHNPLSTAIPQYSQRSLLCRQYNNIWGMITDTHMSEVNDKLIITGSLISRTNLWSQLQFCMYWGGVNFSTTGYSSLSEFFSTHNLTPKLIQYNGQPAIELEPIPNIPVQDMKVVSYTTSESKFPQPIRQLFNMHALNECLNEFTLQDVAEVMNDSREIPGKHWHVYENSIYGSLNGKSIFLEMNYTSGQRVENDELQKALDKEGLSELFLIKFNKYFVIDSSDAKWQRVLRKNKFNKIKVSEFSDLSIDEWMEAIKQIINTIN